MFSKRYQLLEQLGQGGMGVVYRAYDKLTDQTVALKRVLLHPSLQDSILTKPLTSLHDTLPVSDSQEMATQRLSIVREFETLASIRHPYIRPVLEFGFDDEQTPYLVMAYINDPRTIVAAARELDMTGKVRLLIPVLEALAYLHRRHLIHQDLKPANLLVDRTGHVYMVDFGLTMTVTDIAERTGVIGSLPYLAPELLQGEPSTPAADLYAVGIVAYQMFVGRHPFRLDTAQALFADVFEQFADLTPLVAASNPAMAMIVARLLEKSPAKRYADAQTVIADLCMAAEIAPPSEQVQVRESYLTSAPFVGRQSELRELQTALRQASDGHGSAWLVTGQAGVGKSRLLNELRRQALVRGFTVLSGQATEAAGRPYQIWQNVITSLALLTMPDEAELGILGEVAPGVGTALGRDIPPLPPLDGIESQERLARVMLGLLSRIATPIVLLLEDLHWEHEGLRLLRMLTQQVADLPLLVIGTYRSDEAPYLYGDFPQMRVTHLTALTTLEVETMARAVLGNRAAIPQVVKFLQRHAEGNALLIVETLRSLAERAGDLDKIGSVEFPAQLFTQGVLDMLQRRIQHLPPRAFALLDLAAVLGRELDLKVLGAVVDDDDLDDWLMVCGDAALIEVSHGVWRFSHDKIREGILMQIAPPDRPELHAQAARAIEAAYAHDVQQHARTLADHWSAAGQAEKALAYAVEAGRQLVAADPVSAQTYLTALLQRFPRSLPASARNKVMTVNKLLGTAYAATATYGLARQHLETAITLAHEFGDPLVRCQAMLELGNLHWEQGTFDAAESYLSASIGIAKQGKYWREAVRGLVTLALVLRALHKSEHAARSLQDGRDLLRAQVMDVYDLLVAVNYAEGIIRWDHSPEEALLSFHKALDLSRSFNYPRQTVQVLNSIGYTQMGLGQYEQALLHLREAQQLAHSLSSRYKFGTILSNLAETCSRMGRHEEAMRYLAQSLKVGLEMRNIRAILDGIFAAAGLYMRIGRTREAAEFVATLLAHPALTPEDRRIIERDLLPTLQLTLVPTVLTTILQRGRFAEPFKVAEGLLMHLRVN